MSLNSKKSWHPGKASNVARVQKREQEELELRRKSERRRQELDQERLLEESKDRDSTATPKKKLDWMYATNKPIKPATSGNVSDHEFNKGSLLLGATKVDEKMLAQKQAETKEAKDTARKLAADPMAGILAQRSTRRKGRRISSGNGKVSKS